MYNWKISYSYLLIAPNLPIYLTVMEPELKKENRKSHSFMGLEKYHWYYYAVVSTSRHLTYTFFMLHDWSVGRDAVSFLRPGLKFVYQLIYVCSYPKIGAPEFRLLKLMSRLYLMTNKTITDVTMQTACVTPYFVFTNTQRFTSVVRRLWTGLCD